MNKIVVEQVKNCKLVYERSEENGHDCWGNYEWSTNYFIRYKGKEEQVWEDWWIRHDGTNVLDYASKEKWLDIPRVDSTPTLTISNEKIKQAAYKWGKDNVLLADDFDIRELPGFEAGVKWALKQLNS